MTTASLTQHERRLEWALAAAATLGGVAVTGVAATYGITHSTGVGAGFMPTIAGVLLISAGLVWVVQLVHSGRVASRPVAPAGTVSNALVELISEDDIGDESDEHSFPDAQGWRRVGLLAGSILVAALLLPYLGFTLTMVGLLSLILIALAKRRVWIALLVALAVSLGARLVFEVWLGTGLPHSVIPPFSWLGI